MRPGGATAPSATGTPDQTGADSLSEDGVRLQAVDSKLAKCSRGLDLATAQELALVEPL
jgi:hypothetical protein